MKTSIVSLSLLTTSSLNMDVSMAFMSPNSNTIRYRSSFTNINTNVNTKIKSLAFPKNSNREGISMYFDDISRSKYIIPWNSRQDDTNDTNNSNNNNDDNINIDIDIDIDINIDTDIDIKNEVENGIYFSDGRQGFRTNSDGNTMKNYSQQRLDALQRTLNGYDPTSASDLSIEEVLKDVRSWYENADIGKEFFQMRRNDIDYGDDDIDDDDGDVIICTETTLIGCMTFLWEHINDYTIEVAAAGRNYKNNININNEKNNDNAMMIIFPYCQSIYNYNEMSKWYNLILKCQKLCPTFGHEFDISLFHPTYENEPKMLSLIRHSPFPSFALHRVRDEWEVEKENLWMHNNDIGMDSIFGKSKDSNSDRSGNSGNSRSSSSNTGRRMDDTGEDNIDSIFNEYFDQRRSDFEALFNSGAASSSLEQELSSDSDIDNGNGNDSSSSASYSSTNLVISLVKDWILNNLQNDKGEENMALQFANTNDDRFVITDSISEEDLYNEIWNTIDELYTLGREESTSNNNDHSYGDDNDDKEETRKDLAVMSTIFITRKYNAYNANQFKRFAITVNGMLKEFTNGEMFLELFHPEFVGKKSSQSHSRRSPFPMLQICFRKI